MSYPGSNLVRLLWLDLGTFQGFFPINYYFLLCSLEEFSVHFNEPLHELGKLGIF